MRDDATGRITMGVFALADMVAASSTFQTKVGVETAEAAMTHIYRWGINEESPGDLYTAMPYAVIWQASMMDAHQVAGGSFNLLATHCGTILVVYAKGVTVMSGRQAAGDTFAAFVDGLINDMVALAGSGEGTVYGHFDLTKLSLLRPLKHYADASRPYWEAVFLAERGSPG